MGRGRWTVGVAACAVGCLTITGLPAGAAVPPAPLAAGTSVDEGVEPTIEEVPVTEAPAARGSVQAQAVGEATFTAEATGEDAVVGVTWPEGSAPEGLVVELRTRADDVWSEWQVVEVQDDDEGDETGGEATVRGGTDPVFVGAATDVEARVTTPDGSLPDDTRLVVIDPGERAEDAAPTGEPAETLDASAPADDWLGDVTLTAAGPVVADDALAADEALVLDGVSVALPAAAPRTPVVYSRAQWGADESLMTWTPQIGSVDGAVIHHTAGSNDYTAAQVPSIIRGIYAYHAVSRGWGDIGYNFLVDKFGRVWEGRAGGIDRAVVGAHAVGVNSQKFGVSVMGNYDTVGVPAAVVESVSQVLAWKLSLHGVRPTASNVVGHRDVGQTTCPGRYLYSWLPQLRANAAARQGDFSERTYVRDLGTDGYPDLLVRNSSSVRLGTASSAGWSGPRTVGSGWPAQRTVAPGDWDGDGVPDLMIVDSSTGRLRLYSGTSAGGWKTPRVVGTGWGIMNLVVGGHDWTGDGRTDLLARRTADGSLWLYPGDGQGGFGASRRVGTGWASFSSITMIGRLADGRPALVARDPGGVLHTYRGDGRGGFSGAPTRLGSGWNAMTALVGAGDVTDDGAVDLVARDTSGTLWRYAGDGHGSFLGRSLIGTGWQSFGAVLAAGRSGRGEDFFAVQPSGGLLRYSFLGGAAFDARKATGVSGSGVRDVIAPGDWGGDGKPDLIVRRTDGRLFLHNGRGDGTFATNGAQIGNGWSGMASVVGAGNWLGTGVPGLIALERSSGRIWLYPGDGRGGFGARMLLGTGAGGMDLLVSAGRWSGRGVPDLITRQASSGNLYLWRGNGGALLGSPVAIGKGWSGMRSVVGVGDADGDGAPDLLATRSDGALLLYPGNGVGGFRSTRGVGSVGGSDVVS